MTDADTRNIISDLPSPLPGDYLDFIQKESENSKLLTMAYPKWQEIVSSFMREWYPLNNHLFPIHYPGNGIFACLHLGLNSAQAPVVLWDVAADLAEQPFMQVADNWKTYKELVDNEGKNFLDDFEMQAELRQASAAEELKSSLLAFRESVKRFHSSYREQHQGKSFEHHLENAMPKLHDWRPERLAVQDHLIGVMTSRFNKFDNAIDVIGFCTRDHTNFARASATAGLLISLLCEWATTDAEWIRFAIPGDNQTKPGRDIFTFMLPYEVALLGWIMGCNTRPEQEMLESKQAEKLFYELTPFPPVVRRRIASLNMSVRKACLCIHKQIWSPLEIALLAEWCPDVEVLLNGEIYAGEQLRFSTLLYHARAAALLGFGQNVLLARAETSEKMNPHFDILTGSHKWTYTARFEMQCSTEWRILKNGSYEAFTASAMHPLVLTAFPDWRNSAEDLQIANRLYEALKAQADGEEITILGIIPDKIRIDTEKIPFPISPIDKDIMQMDMAMDERFRTSRRLHR